MRHGLVELLFKVHRTLEAERAVEPLPAGAGAGLAQAGTESTSGLNPRSQEIVCEFLRVGLAWLKSCTTMSAVNKLSHESPGTVIPVRRAGGCAADRLSLDSPRLEGKGRVQFPYVSAADAAPDDAAKPAGEPLPPAPAVHGALPAGAGVRTAVSSKAGHR